MLLVLGTSSLFAADVSHHKSCYEYFYFRSLWWKKIGNSNRAKDSVLIDDPLYELFSLIQFHIIDRYEIYTLAKLRNFHQYKTATEKKSVKLRSIDLKNKLKNEQFCQINCLKFY